MGQRGQIPQVTGALLVLIGNGHKLLPFNQRSAASLKRICAAYSFPREQGEHKAYVDPHQACMDPCPAFTCSLGQDELHTGDSVYPVLISSGGEWNVLIPHYGNLLLLFLHSAFSGVT